MKRTPTIIFLYSYFIGRRVWHYRKPRTAYFYE